MKNKFKKIIVTAVFMFFLMLLSSCSKNYDSYDSKPIKIKLNEVTHSVFYTPQYVALGLGYFKEEGLEVELSCAQGSEKTMMAVLSSQADIGLLGASAVMNAYKESGDKPILFAGLTQRDGSFLIGRTPEFKWEELKNKKIIAGRKGGVPKMVLEYILRKKGLTPGKDVELIDNIQFDLMGVAFIRGTGDFVTLFEPTASNLTENKDFYILKPLGKECEKTAYTCYCCLKNYSEKNPDILKKFIKAIYRAQKWVCNHNAEEIVNVITPFFVDSDKKLLIKCVENYIEADVWCENPLITEKELNLMEEIMIESGELENKLDFEKILDKSYAKKILGI